MKHCYWSATALHTALPLLIKELGYSTVKAEYSLPTLSNHAVSTELTGWFEHAVLVTGIEIEHIGMRYGDLAKTLRQIAPAIVPLNSDTYIVLLGSNRRTLRLLGQDGRVYKYPLKHLKHRLVQALEHPLLTKLEETIAPLELTNRRRVKMLSYLLHDQLADADVGDCFLLRPPMGSFWQQLRHAALPQKMAAFVTCLLSAQILMVLSWLVIGESVFHHAGFQGMLTLWGLLLVTAVPLQVLSLRIKNGLSLDVGCLLRKRLFEGILQLKSNDIRHQGSGSFLNQVMNIEFLEGQCLSMVLLSFMALVSLLFAFFVLLMGAGGWTHAMLLCAFVVAFSLCAARHYKHMRAWVLYSRTLSQHVTEIILGHRTRLVQQQATRWHDDEDLLLARYATLSERWDRSEAMMKTVLGRRGWLLVGFVGLYPALTGISYDVSLLAVSIGGVLLAAVALEQLGQSFRHVMGAMIVWQQLRGIYQSGERVVSKQALHYVAETTPAQGRGDAPLLQVQNISFAYESRKNDLLNGCGLSIKAGQKLLLTGASGSGKSTLAAILAGLEQAKSGSIHLFGLSLAAWGDDAWRRRVVVAPQFQENHLFNESFAFNLLMGRAWPPSDEDLLEAETVCRELQLGIVLDSMPAGMQQMLGESGWQLSHGERSRLFIARTLLQRASLIILDESFAALDPQTLKVALACVLQRSNALLLIAHP